MSKDLSGRYKKTEKIQKKVLWKISKSYWRRKNRKQEYGHEQYKNL